LGGITGMTLATVLLARALVAAALGVRSIEIGLDALFALVFAAAFFTTVSGPLTLVWLLLAAVWSWRRATLPASSAAHS